MAWVEYPAAAVIYGRRGGPTTERAARANARGCALVHRRSGGGAVLAGPWMLGMHLWLPPAHALAQKGAIGVMQWMGAAMGRGLRAQGLHTTLADTAAMASFNERAQQLDLQWACYAGLSHGELLAPDGRKCLGLSQARLGGGVLLSAGLLTATPPWEWLEHIHTGLEPPRSALRDLAGEGWATAPLRQPLMQRLGAHLGTALGELETPADMATAEPIPMETT